MIIRASAVCTTNPVESRPKNAANANWPRSRNTTANPSAASANSANAPEFAASQNAFHRSTWTTSARSTASKRRPKRSRSTCSVTMPSRDDTVGSSIVARRSFRLTSTSARGPRSWPEAQRASGRIEDGEVLLAGSTFDRHHLAVEPGGVDPHPARVARLAGQAAIRDSDPAVRRWPGVDRRHRAAAIVDGEGSGAGGGSETEREEREPRSADHPAASVRAGATSKASTSASTRIGLTT